MPTVISVENLSKAYRLGQIGTGSLSRDINVWLAKVRGKPNPMLKIGEAEHGNRDGETIWALKDVNFTVEQGEVLGIIGRNGAGKSTLLKILSRVTAPTSGHARVRGRIASLLEVGTGFHPDLTGRENIYLNGAILGMTRQEVRRKFDEIVAFAEIEQFIDTPVKRYSSGMYVRLAFAVAAHLDPEILVVDEVLAVGDAEFQKKCLGKMGDVAHEGRTILFVSHNMQAIQSLCIRAIQIANGIIVDSGETRSVVNKYFSSFNDNASEEMNWSIDSAPGDADFKLLAVRLRAGTYRPNGIYLSRENLIVETEFILNRKITPLCVGFDLLASEGSVILRSFQTDLPKEKWLSPQVGKNIWQCMIPGGMLNGGTYFLCPRVGIHNQYWIVYMDPLIKFEIVLDHGVSPLWNAYNNIERPGLLAPIFNWQVVQP